MKQTKKRASILYQFLHNLSFKHKLLITHLLIVLVPTLVVFLFLYGRLSRTITINTIESEQALVTQTANTLAANIDQLDLAMDTITSSPFLSKALLSGNINFSHNTLQTLTEERQFLADVNALIDHELITDIRIYLPTEMHTHFAHQSFSCITEPLDSVHSSYWYGIFAGTPSTVSLLCPTFYLTNHETKEHGSLAYIKKFTNIADSNDECSYIAIYFSNDYIQQILEQSLTNIDSTYYLVNSRNNVVAATDDALTGTYFMRYETIPYTIHDRQQFTTLKILDENVYVSYRDIDKTDWRLVSVIPVNSILSDGEKILMSTVWIYIIIIVLTCIVSLLLSGSIANRLSLVVTKMNQYRDKIPVKLEIPTAKDEIGQLVDNYNIMVDRIHHLVTQQTETAEKLKVSEVQALQAQINPHFLYNMLDMINWLAQDGKQREVTIAVQTLSKFYKLTLSKKDITTSIREELRHVGLYVKLQNMRYEDSITFIVDVPDEILDYQIPKLVLQPIVENAIQHGIFETDKKKGTIVITAWMQGRDIVFLISDTGVGIPPEILPHILTGKGQQGTGSNIAIHNTHLRLQLLYGTSYGLHYESTVGSGTEVQIKIPAKNGD